VHILTKSHFFIFLFYRRRERKTGAPSKRFLQEKQKCFFPPFMNACQFDFYQVLQHTYFLVLFLGGQGMGNGVTRLGELSPIEQLFSSRSFGKITKVA
jgi:hypothetical protein